MALNIDSVTELYDNYKPAYNNLYEVLIFDSKVTGNSNIYDVENYIKFHAINISFNGESLGLTRNEVTKQFQLNDTQAYKRSDTLTIQWEENEDWLVKKYHDTWLSLFYNKEKDYYYSHDENSRKQLYKTIKVVLPKSNAFSGECDCITFINVLPNNTPGLNLSWGASASIVNHSLTYYVTDWKWDTYNTGEESNTSTNTTASGGSGVNQSVMS